MVSSDIGLVTSRRHGNESISGTSSEESKVDTNASKYVLRIIWKYLKAANSSWRCRCCSLLGHVVLDHVMFGHVMVFVAKSRPWRRLSMSVYSLF